MSDLDLYADLSTGRLTSRDGGTPILPPLVLGDRPRCRLQTVDRNEDGEVRLKDLRVRTLSATLGKVMEPSTGGAFKLIGSETNSENIGFNGSADAMKTALALISAEPPADINVSLEAPGCWLVIFAAGEVDFGLHENTLTPESFVRIRRFQQSGKTCYEIRLIQAPLSANVDGHERVLAPPPSVRRVRAGAAATPGVTERNELQDIYFPPEFRGTYFLRTNDRVTRVLGMEDGPDEMAAALQEMWPDRLERYTVSNAEPDHEYVEFVNSLGGEPHPLIEVEVNTFQPGVLTFDLPLDWANLATALRSVKEIEQPLEVEVEIVRDDQNPADPAIPGRIVTLFQQPFKIVREQKWRELGVVPNINWLRPPAPRDYIPFTPDQIIIGQQSYTAVFGNGVLRSFSFAHNLGTAALSGIVVRQNAAGGTVKVLGTDFTVTLPSANELVLDIVAGRATPALNSLAIVITTAGPISAFQAHTHTEAQVVNLVADLTAIRARLAALENLSPLQPLSRSDDEDRSMTIAIPDRSEIFPGIIPEGASPQNVAILPPAVALLPAIHGAASLVAALPGEAAAYKGQIFQNTSAVPIVLGPGLGRRKSTVGQNGYFGSDGRTWYRLSRKPESNSYYPTDFERTLFRFPVNDRMLRAGSTVTVEFRIDLALLRANTAAQIVLVIEVGSDPAQTAPAPVGENIESEQWIATPMLAQRIMLSDLRNGAPRFGAIISRSPVGALTAQRMVYGGWEGGAQVPASADFVIRARLIQFDTENSVPTATGFVFYELTEGKIVVA